MFLIFPFGSGLTALSYSLPFLLRRDIRPEEAAIIYMDWDSHVRLGQEQFRRWDRALHTQLLHRLKQMHAKVVAFDVVFLPFTNDPAADREFVHAVRDHGKVVVGAMVAPDVQEGQIIGWRLTKPFPELEAAAKWGVVEVGGEDRTVRQHYFRRDYDAPSLAWRTAELTMATPPEPFTDRWINFYGPPGILPHYSYWQVLATNAISATALSNKVVFIGALYDIGMAGGKGTDDFRTPYTMTTGRRSPGVEVTATAYLNLFRRDWLNRLPTWAELMLIALLGGLAGFAPTVRRPLPAILYALVGVMAVAAGAMALVWSKSLWFPWLIVAGVQIPCALGWGVFSFLFQRRSFPVALPVKWAGERDQTPADNKANVERAVAGPLAQAPPIGPEAERESELRIPEYSLVRKIGKGAYGEVWLAQSIIGSFTAVKIVHRDGFPDDEPYEREFKGLCKFTPISRSHPGFMHVLHVGRNREAGYIYYVMELADDELNGQRINPSSYSPKNLAKELKRRSPFPLHESLRIGADLAAALDVLHQHQLIHRDIKPGNIIFVNGAAKLADIGLVTDIAQEGRRVTYLGTKDYIPPEGPGTPAGDVYSLGKVLYEASVGFDVSRFPELPTALMTQPADDPMFQLNEIILKACEADSSRRFRSAGDLHHALLKLQRNVASQATLKS